MNYSCRSYFTGVADDFIEKEYDKKLTTNPFKANFAPSS
jgi:hypothetical protein